jgi:hypothetical protein
MSRAKRRRPAPWPEARHALGILVRASDVDSNWSKTRPLAVGRPPRRAALLRVRACRRRRALVVGRPDPPCGARPRSAVRGRPAPAAAAAAARRRRRRLLGTWRRRQRAARRGVPRRRSAGAEGDASSVQRALSERRARAQGGCRDRRRRHGAAIGRGQARGERGSGCAYPCGTQRGKHARAQTQAHYKQEEGKGGTRRVERRWQRRVRSSDELSGGERLKQRSGGAKMDARAVVDAEAVVLTELKSGRNSEKLANALSLLTALQ